MEPQKLKLSPKDFFLYIGAMVTLYASAVAFVDLWFEYINNLFPDKLMPYHDPYSTSIRIALAALVVIFPLYIFLTRINNQDVRRNPEKQALPLRKWLIYLTLFIAGITIVVDLITLINYFLGGDITTRFVSKVAVVLVVIGSIFAYYFYDLRGAWERNARQSVLLGWIAGALVIGSIAAGFFIIGSPMNQRDLRFDQQKIQDLQNIQWQVVSYWQQKQKLPGKLSELQDSISGFNVPMDSETDEGYRYEATGSLSFKLCAMFNKGTPEGSYEGLYDGRMTKPVPIAEPAEPNGVPYVQDSWQHGEGEQCFERTIDPDRYPPFKR